MSKSNVLAREVRRLALPAIAHSLLQTLVFIVDRIMLGRHGSVSLAAMQIGGTLEWSIWSVFAAFEVGTIARVGRHVGAGDRVGAQRAARLSLAVAVAVGTALAASAPGISLMLPYAAQGASSEAVAEAHRYLVVTIGASPAVFVAVASTAILQASGDTRTPLVIGVVANALHIALNRVLILGAFGVVPPLGAQGAGISTAVSFTLEAALAIGVLMNPKRPASLRATERTQRSWRVVRDEFQQLVKVGGPSFVERVLYHVGFLTYALIVARLGDDAMAANQALISVESICFLSADGFGIAAAALVAQKLGAMEPSEARQAAWIAARYAIVALTSFGLIAALLREAILPVFSADPGVLSIGRATMPVLAIAQPFMAASIVLAQALRGAGRTREVLAVSVIGAIVIRLSATWLFAVVLDYGLVGVWMGSTCDWAVRAIVLGCWIRFRW